MGISDALTINDSEYIDEEEVDREN